AAMGQRPSVGSAAGCAVAPRALAARSVRQAGRFEAPPAAGAEEDLPALAARPAVLPAAEGAGEAPRATRRRRPAAGPEPRSAVPLRARRAAAAGLRPREVS